MATWTVLENQNIFDVCLQLYGTLDMLLRLVRDNNLPGITAVLTPGQVLVYDNLTDNQVQVWMQRTGTVIATGQYPSGSAGIPPDPPTPTPGEFNNDFNNDFSNE